MENIAKIIKWCNSHNATLVKMTNISFTCSLNGQNKKVLLKNI